MRNHGGRTSYSRPAAPAFTAESDDAWARRCAEAAERDAPIRQQWYLRGLDAAVNGWPRNCQAIVIEHQMAYEHGYRAGQAA